MKRLNGKVCVVTAAGQGIGRATVERMVAEGAQVIATDINAAGLEEIDGVERQVLDVRDGAAITKFAQSVQAKGPIDVLFNCAGIVQAGSILECTEEDWDVAFALNVKSMYRMIKAFLPAMIAGSGETGGTIINMSSVASSLKGVPNRFAYTTSKAAIIGLTKSIAADFVGQNIRCHAICPGTVDTPSLHDRLRATGDYDQAMKDFVARQPMGRLGQAEEIAALATYLASDEAKFMTGQTHVIDGGWAL